MKRKLGLCLIGIPICLLNAVMALAQETAVERPNVVLIITDDAGYGDLGSYGATDLQTPNIDRLASEGVRFTDFYANGATCTPTRVALMTGRYQQRLGGQLEGPLGGRTTSGLPVTGRSLPQLLQDNGYATALTGKWHLGLEPQFHPQAHGFTYFFGFLSAYMDYYTHIGQNRIPDLWENTTPVDSPAYLTDLITERSVGFIEANREGPFFLEVAFNAPHWPYQVPDAPSVARDNARHLGPGDEDTSTRADYIAMVERVDQGVGRILATLEAAGLAENTLVVFTNDNGGEWLSRNAPLFHRKQTIWEGGIRVPAIMRWPGRIPADRTTSQVGITMDLTATILAATNTPVPEEANLDGIDLIPLIQESAEGVERTLFWRVGGFWRQRAVRRGNWKLLVDGTALMLFDLGQDLGERMDLARTQTNLVADLRGLIRDWEDEVNAEAELLNPTDPGTESPAGGSGRGVP